MGDGRCETRERGGLSSLPEARGPEVRGGPERPRRVCRAKGFSPPRTPHPSRFSSASRTSWRISMTERACAARAVPASVEPRLRGERKGGESGPELHLPEKGARAARGEPRLSWNESIDPPASPATIPSASTRERRRMRCCCCSWCCASKAVMNDKASSSVLCDLREGKRAERSRGGDRGREGGAEWRGGRKRAERRARALRF